MKQLISVAVVAVLAVAAPAVAGITYNETVDGDFSGNRLAPSSLNLGNGSNLISGTFGSTTPTSDTFDFDYVTVTVPGGMELHKLVVTNANVGGAFAFIGIEAGTQVSVPYNTSSAATLLGWEHFGSTFVGTDLFPAMRVAPGAQGFTGSLPSGQYTLWIMELNTTDVFSYGFDLQVRPIPEPCALGLVGLGTVGLVRRRRA